MFSTFAKTTIVKPLRENYDFAVLQKGNNSQVHPFKKSKESIGIFGKQSHLIKSLNEDKKNKFSKLDSAYTKLHDELQEIQKWKVLIEIENQEKNKKIEELTQSTEVQRKIAVNYQLENENFNLQLMEEMQQRSFVSEKLHAAKEIYAALKKHFNTLQGHFEYRNRIEDMIKAADNKRCTDVENLKEMFNKMQLEQSGRIDYLNCALEAETNKFLNVSERFQLKLGEMEHEKENMCIMVQNLENEIGTLGKQLDTEKKNVQFLEKEKETLKYDLTEMQTCSEHYITLLREQKEELKNIEVSREEKVKQLDFQSSIIKDLEAKCNDLSETIATLCAEASAVQGLKEVNEQFKSKIVDLEKRLKEEEDKSFELLSSLQTWQNQHANLERKINEDVIKLKAFEDLQVKYNEVNASNTALLKEKAELEMKLEDFSSHFLELKGDKEKLSLLCEENSEIIINIKKDCAEQLASEANKLNNIQTEYEQLFSKLETTNQCLAEKSKTLAEMEEKIHEVDNLRASLTKAEDDLNWQKQSTFNVLKLLQDTEEKYNQDRLAKETEIISCKRQIESFQFNTKMLECEVEDLKKLESVNIKLKEDIENLKMDISDLLKRNQELKSRMGTVEEISVTTTLDTCVEEKKQNAAGIIKEDYPKGSGIQGKLAKICDERVIDPEPRARDLDSSGSEYLELVYDEKLQEPIGLSATKFGKNKSLVTSEPTLLPFKTKRKRDVQNVTQEDIVRKKFGLPPRKNLGDLHDSSSLKTQISKNLKKQDFSNAKVRLENSPWKFTANSPAPALRKFLTKHSEENTPKFSDIRKPWF